MAQAQSWGDVKVGLFALVGIVGVAASVLLFARVGALHGDTVRLYAATSQARGLLPGSEVWVAGRKVGLVREIGFRPPSADTSLRVLLTLDVLESERTQIRRRAPVAIRPGTSLIGSPVLAISPTATGGPAVQEGDTLYANPGNEFESVRLRLTRSLGTDLPLIVDNMRILATQLETARGTLGALGIEGPDQVAATASRTTALLEHLTAGRGIVGSTMQGDINARTQAIMARVGSLRARMSDPRYTAGRLRGPDSTFARTVAELQADLADVQRALDEPRGTLGRFQHDGALRDDLARAHTELDAIIVDAKRNPLRYTGF